MIETVALVLFVVLYVQIYLVMKVLEEILRVLIKNAEDCEAMVKMEDEQ
jgi:hypothetical protein